MNTQATLAGNEVKPGLSDQYRAKVWQPLLLFILFTFAITLASYAVFQRHKENIKIDKQNELGGIAELKAGQITHWMEERRNDAQALKNDPLFLAEAGRWLQQGGPAGEAKTKLIERLSSLQQAYADYGYSSIALLDNHAIPRLSSSADNDPTHERENGRVLESMRSGQVIFSDIHRKKRGTAEVLEMDLVAPLFVGKGKQAHAIGAVLFHIDPQHFLFPLIQRWPTRSPSAENLLVRRDGDEVVFLNELRHRKNTPLAMRFPLDQQQLPAAIAVMGQEGLVEGVDYRGVPVVGVLNKVAGTSWFMVSKIDQAEIYAPINQLANWMMALMLALVGTGGGIALFWRQKEKRQYESELQRQALAKHLSSLAKYANDIILLLDSTGKIVDFNDRALEAYGYSAEDFSTLNISDLRAIDFTPSYTDRLEEINRAESLRFESVHVRRNGEHFPIESSVRAVNIDGKRFHQAIIRDITERMQAKEELTRQKDFIRQVIDSSPNLIFVRDTEGKFLLANEAMAKSYGQTTENIVGKYNWELAGNKEQIAEYDRANREVLENRQEQVALEPGVLADGKSHWFQTIREPLLQSDGSASVLTIAMDITELKETEELLQINNRALRLLSACNMALVHIAEEGRLLTEVCKLIVETGGYRMAWIGLAEHDPEKNVRPVARYGSDDGYLDSANISWADTERGRGPIGIAIRTGITQINQNFLTNPLLALWREAALARGFQSSIALPLRSGIQTFGTLAIYSATPCSFSTDEVILLEELADNLAWGITALRIRTEHEQAIEMLRKSEEHFRFLTENATDMTYLISLPDGHYDYVSPSSDRLTGYTPEEFYNSPKLMETIIHPDWHAYCEEQWGKFLMGEIPAYFEFQIIHKSGETRWIHQRNAPIWGDDESKALVAIQGVVTDITEQKQATEQRQQQKTFLQQIIDTDPNLIYVKDAAGKFLMVNQAMADFYCMEMQKMIGKSDVETYPEQKGISGYLESNTEALTGEHEVILAESSLMPDDKQRWYLTIKKPLMQADGSVSVLGIAVDITAHKLSEIKLARSYRKLQQLSLHLENIRAEERARIALNLHDEMGATLVAIKMSIAWLALKLPAGMPEFANEMDHLTELVSAGIQTMRQTVTQLNPGRLDDVGLVDAIRDYVNKFRQHTEIECMLTLPKDELALDANQSATIFRIVQEALNNVIKHAKASEVHIILKKRGKSLLLTVEDNGIGLNQGEHKEESFGLLGIRERALMVGGKARIKSQPGKGTQVSASIPLPAGNNPLDTV